MKIYIASHNQDEGRRLKTLLRRAGYVVVSSWLTDKRFGQEKYTLRQCRQIARRDVREVLQCDLLILMAGPDLYPGGKFIEAGVALGSGAHLVVLGRRENMVLWHPRILAVETTDDLKTCLARFSHD